MSCSKKEENTEQTSGTTVEPETPDNPKTPENPEEPENPEKPEEPEIPENPGVTVDDDGNYHFPIIWG